jgi:uncharacterized protein YyaL (SSP411 family)
MNAHLISIKVDREERPDVDAVYMAATQAMTGQGGWPMTVFMTAEGEPFYCGTYFPRDYFQRLIRGVVKAWREDRDSVNAQAKKVSLALAERAGASSRVLREAGLGQAAGLGLDELAGEGWDPAGAGGRRLAADCDAAVRGLAAGFDERHGGFGQAPKFPPSMVLEFLLRHHTRSDADGWALRMAGQTMEAMARGGMYDQLGGGFARYSVDAAWVVPHFEKMLYDNALLARDYLHLWRLTAAPLARRVAEQTCDWMVKELRTQEGGLAAALDADSEGEEGKFYTWTRDELTAVLGLGDGQFAADVFGVTTSGTFERGLSVLQLRADPAEEARFSRVRQALFAAREERVRPGRDDKVVAAWNGMAIAALAETGLLLGRPDLVQVASGAADLLARVHIDAGEPGARIARTSRDGVAGPSAGLLEDYACVADGFLVLSGVTGETRWVDLAGRLLETALARFADGNGGFYDTADDGEPLLYRPADPMDNATPSGSFAVSGALLSYAALTGSAHHRDAAIAVLEPLAVLAERYPLGSPSPGAVVALGDGTGESPVPLLAGRGLADGAPAVYVCRNFTCRAPITGIAELERALSGTK